MSIVTIDDGKANVFGLPMTSAFEAALDEVDPDAGAVVIEGRDGLYSGGFDLKVLNSGDEQASKHMREAGVKLALRVFDFPRPIVAAVTGHAIAMGCIFNMGIDWRIGAKGNFKHGLNEVAKGLALPPFAIEFSRYRLNRQYFQRAVLHSQLFSPEEAIEAGLLDELAEPDRVRQAAREKAEQLARLPNPAYAASKARDRAPAKQLISQAQV